MTHPPSQCPEGYGQDSALAYLCDDDDSEEQQRRFAEHLASTKCEACTEQLRSLTFIQDALDTWHPHTNRAANPLWAKVDADAPPADTRESYSLAAARPSWGFVLRPAWGLGLAATLLIAVAGTVWQPYLSSGTRSDGARGILTDASVSRETSLIAPEPLIGAVDVGSSGRMALVIGNSAYTHAGHLPNPENDAEDMAAALRRLGFQVTTMLNVGREELTETLRVFSRRSVGADISLLFYAGHGLEMARVNYLLPVDARLELDTDLRYEAVPLEDVLAATMGASLRLVILDACRNTPEGLAMRRTAYRSISRGSFVELDERLLGDEMLVAYAAGAGTTAEDGSGRNSPYTSALLGNIDRPLELGLLFREVGRQVLEATNGRQRPHEYQSLLNTHYLSGATPASGAGDVVTPDVEPRQLNVVELSLLAERDDAVAQNEFGERYQYGDGGLVPDYGEAVQWYRKAASQGYAPAQRNLGYMYGEGLGVQADREEALRLARLAADQGEADAISTVGYHYRHGLGGLRQDHVEAVRWFERAAAGGSAFGQANLATMYEDGLGVPQNHAEAVRLYDLAAARENSGRAANRLHEYVQNLLGMMYEDGRGVPRDLAEAARRYRLAAELGNIGGQVSLGYMYESGRGVPQDYVEAGRWYRLAAEQGDSQARNQLGILYEHGHGVPQNHMEAAGWYRLAAEQGDVFAQTNLGLLYENGRGVDRDYAEAARWFRRAAEQGYEEAQKNLRRLDDRTTPRNETRAEGARDRSTVPAAECSEDLGGLTSQTYTRRGEWDGSCITVNYYDGEYARYYNLTLEGAALVTIELTSPEVDTWLALWTGSGTGDERLVQDDDGGDGTNARVDRELPPGGYTIEATTLRGGVTGPFMLTVTVSDR